MTQAPNSPPSDIAVIGAGIAGLSCALTLAQAGCTVTVFEQAAKPGGRLAAKEFDGYQFDCGAQYFTVRSDMFRKQVEQWQDQWLVDEWQAWLVDLEQVDALSHNDDVKRYIGRPLMHSITEDMAELCNVRYNTEIKKLQYKKSQQQWQLSSQQGRLEELFDAVVVAVPAPQAVPLLKPVKSLMQEAKSVSMTPCWSVMLAFSESLQLGFDGAYVVGNELSWMVRDSCKIERENAVAAETWVLHIAPEWSERNLKKSSAKVIEAALGFMCKVSGRDIPAPVFSAAELWPYAKPLNPLTEGSLYDAGMRVGVCGDWCLGARVESAYLSGIAVAGRVLRNG